MLVTYVIHSGETYILAEESRLTSASIQVYSIRACYVPRNTVLTIQPLYRIFGLLVFVFVRPLFHLKACSKSPCAYHARQALVYPRKFIYTGISIVGIKCESLQDEA